MPDNIRVETVLEEIGLTKNEAKVYLALLHLGTTTTSPLIRLVGVNTSKVYESLERLLKKGLVSYTIVRNKKHWQANNIEAIGKYVDEKKESILQEQQHVQSILPRLQERMSFQREISEFSIFEGISGLKRAREIALEELRKGDLFRIILAVYPKEEKLEGFWLEFQQKRAAKGIRCQYVISEKFRELGKKRKIFPLTKVRYVSPKKLSPVWIELYHDVVGIGFLGEKAGFFRINNKEVAKGFKEYFELFWKIAKSV